MALTLNATAVNANFCQSLLFTDTTSNYGTGGNPTYTDIASVQWKLYDSLSTLIGTASNGWIPDTGNTSLYLFPSEFGITGTVFPNDTYSMDYIVTMKNGDVYTKNITGISVSCDTPVPCSFTETVYGNVIPVVAGDYASTTTLTSIKVLGITIPCTDTTPITSQAVLLTVINNLMATSAIAQANPSIMYTQYVASSTYAIKANSYYGSSYTDYNVVLDLNGTPTTRTGNSQSTTTSTQNALNLINITFSCDDKTKIHATETSGYWNRGAYPDYNNLQYPVNLVLSQTGGSVLGTVALDQAHFLTFITDGLDFTPQDFGLSQLDWTPCYNYTLSPEITFADDTLIDCYHQQFILSACGAEKPSDLVVKTKQVGSCDCTQFSVCDETGIFNAVSNSTGYGDSSTCLWSAIYRTNFEITAFSTGNSITIDKGFVPSEIGQNCVNFTYADIESILPQQVAGNTNIPDDIYKIVYTVYNSCDQVLGISTLYVRFVCNLQNCLDNRYAALTCGTIDSAAYQSEMATISRLVQELNMVQNPAIPNDQMDCIAKRLYNMSRQCLNNCPTCF